MHCFRHVYGARGGRGGRVAAEHENTLRVFVFKGGGYRGAKHHKCTCMCSFGDRVEGGQTWEACQHQKCIYRNAFLVLACSPPLVNPKHTTMGVFLVFSSFPPHPLQANTKNVFIWMHFWCWPALPHLSDTSPPFLHHSLLGFQLEPVRTSQNCSVLIGIWLELLGTGGAQ